MVGLYYLLTILEYRVNLNGVKCLNGQQSQLLFNLFLGNWRPGNCYNCGKTGHWAQTCSNRQKVNIGLIGLSIIYSENPAKLIK